MKGVFEINGHPIKYGLDINSLKNLLKKKSY